MLLQRLSEYADRLDIPPTMYKKTRVAWLLPLDARGNLAGQPESTAAGGRPGVRDRGKEFVVPHVGARSYNIKPILLVDTAAYALGLCRADDNDRERDRTSRKHQAFAALVRECHQETNEPDVGAVGRFLEACDQTPPSLGDAISPNDVVGFTVDGRLPTDLPAVQEYWARHTRTSEETDAHEMTCLVCGKKGLPVRLFPVPIRRRIPGGQPSGMALVSVNAESFESFGLKSTAVSPTCHRCAERAGLALNHLLESETTHYTIGGASSVVYVFWTREEIPFVLTTFLQDPQSDDVRKLLESVRSGHVTPAIDETAFYATSLAASGGRVAVRDWLETTVGGAKRNLARYFTLQQVVGTNQEVRPLPLWMLQRSLLPPRRGRSTAHAQVPAVIEAALLRCAIEGGPLQEWLLYKAVARNSAERKVTTARAALIKMVMLSRRNQDVVEEGEMVSLDRANKDPGYVCGRLLAVLESTQRLAIGDPNKTLVDRFYGTASSAPNSVFPALMRVAQAHLAKLRRDKPGLHVYLQRQLEEVTGFLAGFPKVLRLTQQGSFALGYYHQRAFRPASDNQGDQPNAQDVETVNPDEEGDEA